MHKYKDYYYAIVLLLIGIELILESFNVHGFRLTHIKGWWTFFLIIPGIAELLFNKGDFLQNSILLSVGIILFLWQNDFFKTPDIGKLSIAGVLILIGLSSLFKRR